MSTNQKRIRGRPLQRIRRRVLEANPLCVRCLAKDPEIVRAAVEVDHIIPVEHDGADDPHDDSNRQPLCRRVPRPEDTRGPRTTRAPCWV
jgi:5-methylcytosine-specific restriction endonuclease McrA